MKTPYDTGKVRIGSNYFPVVNYHNPDQDWIQKVALGEKTFWTAETVVMGIIWLLVAYAIAGLLSACSTPPTVPAAYSYASAPVVGITLDPKVQQMTRNEVIEGINQCESNSMRAVVITSKRVVSGFLSEIPIDVQCYPKRTIF